ncbi:hypothetical protein C479_07196 [Halovivax asiaticus JCM 14624]|uniref:Uncharacterized protein n=1 Tax=Halovivax asiaticus JCM 14624 TaxID=1227490 RepID=M0BL98_9EURY|nr:hypothetical protein C479_07196 [Halovivax asiaticus JCM 14624]
MIGGSGTRRAGGSVDRERLERALREWEYETSPTAAASLATYLDSQFPDASVDRPGGGDEAAVVIDDVAICFADAFGRRFRTAFHILRESYDGVFCYSVSAHADDPTESVSYTHLATDPTTSGSSAGRPRSRRNPASPGRPPSRSFRW